jgi:hypothetical protein
MTADVLALIDTYATGMQIAMWGWLATVVFLHLFAAWLFIHAIRAAHASLTRAIRLCHDVERQQYRAAATFTDQARKETPQP